MGAMLLTAGGRQSQLAFEETKVALDANARLVKILNRLEIMNNLDEVLNQMSRLVTANSTSMSILGARNLVLGIFLDAVLPRLTAVQRAEASQSFRQRIEDAFSLMDDVALPAEYHSSMLQLTNAILASLSQESATRK